MEVLGEALKFKVRHLRLWLSGFGSGQGLYGKVRV